MGSPQKLWALELKAIAHNHDKYTNTFVCAINSIKFVEGCIL